MITEGRHCLGDDVLEVAKVVLNAHGQEVVGDHVLCGEIPLAVEEVAKGIHQRVVCREANPEQARVWCVLLGLNPASIDNALTCEWN